MSKANKNILKAYSAEKEGAFFCDWCGARFKYNWCVPRHKDADKACPLRKFRYKDYHQRLNLLNHMVRLHKAVIDVEKDECDCDDCDVCIIGEKMGLPTASSTTKVLSTEEEDDEDEPEPVIEPKKATSALLPKNPFEIFK